MNQDLFDRLQARQQQLLELFLEESDPARWPGAGVAQVAMDKSTRGDRVWCKRDAAASLALATRIGGFVQTVLDRAARHPDDPPPPEAGTDGDDDLQREVDLAEKEALRMLNAAGELAVARAVRAAKAPR